MNIFAMAILATVLDIEPMIDGTVRVHLRLNDGSDMGCFAYCLPVFLVSYPLAVGSVVSVKIVPPNREVALLCRIVIDGFFNDSYVYALYILRKIHLLRPLLKPHHRFKRASYLSSKFRRFRAFHDLKEGGVIL